MYNRIMLKIKLYRLELRLYKIINKKLPRLSNLIRKNLNKNVLNLGIEIKEYIK